MIPDIEHTKRIIRKSVSIGWLKVRYEEMILVPCPEIGASLAEALGLSIPPSRQDEAAFYAARALRLEFRESNFAWADRLSQGTEMERLIEIVIHEVAYTLERRKPPRILKSLLVSERVPGANGFVPWIPFSSRNPVPCCSGVYLLARFEARPNASAEPCDERVIDIGKADRQTIQQRLRGFRDVALTGRGGESSGWPYRNDFVRDYEELINFSGLYAAWRTFPWTLDESIGDYEDRLLKEYYAKWGQRPAINRQPFKR